MRCNCAVQWRPVPDYFRLSRTCTAALRLSPRFAACRLPVRNGLPRVFLSRSGLFWRWSALTPLPRASKLVIPICVFLSAGTRIIVPCARKISRSVFSLFRLKPCDYVHAPLSVQERYIYTIYYYYYYYYYFVHPSYPNECLASAQSLLCNVCST